MSELSITLCRIIDTSHPLQIRKSSQYLKALYVLSSFQKNCSFLLCDFRRCPHFSPFSTSRFLLRIDRLSIHSTKGLRCLLLLLGSWWPLALFQFHLSPRLFCCKGPSHLCVGDPSTKLEVGISHSVLRPWIYPNAKDLTPGPKIAYPPLLASLCA